MSSKNNKKDINVIESNRKNNKKETNIDFCLESSNNDRFQSNKIKKTKLPPLIPINIPPKLILEKAYKKYNPIRIIK